MKINKEDRSGLFIPAGLFIGMGVGFFVNQIVGGIFVGLGLGFLAMAVAKSAAHKHCADCDPKDEQKTPGK